MRLIYQSVLAHVDNRADHSTMRLQMLLRLQEHLFEHQQRYYWPSSEYTALRFNGHFQMDLV